MKTKTTQLEAWETRHTITKSGHCCYTKATLQAYWDSMHATIIIMYIIYMYLLVRLIAEEYGCIDSS